ncbi:hypothetical protein ABIC09_004745 [Bradyrhizobium sp. S3.12.5]|uniref:hypothetical protein n=1 Tax=Bradyrhizobium sp. S3.12.5 TaxID=3156386 RepID=UPI003399D688
MSDPTDSRQELIPTVSPPTPVDGEAVQRRRADYNRLVRTAKLAGLLLEKVDFKMLPDALGIKASLLTRSISPTTTVISSGAEDGTCVANVVWEVVFKYKTKSVMRCKASYIISYDGIENASDETVGVFVDNVGKTATYAYFRALYAHLDWSAGLGSEPLPVLQLQPKL